MYKFCSLNQNTASNEQVPKSSKMVHSFAECSQNQSKLHWETRLTFGSPVFVSWSNEKRFSLPRITVHYCTLPFLTLHYRTLPFLTLYYLTLSYITFLYLVLPYITVHYLSLPCNTLQYCKLPYITFPYLVLPYITVELPYPFPYLILVS